MCNYGASKMLLTPTLASTAVRSKVVFLLLRSPWLMLLSSCVCVCVSFVFCPSFVMQHLVPFLVLQSSR